MFFVSLVWVSLLIFFIQKQSHKKINYLLLFLGIVFGYLFLSSAFCLSDIDDLGQCNYFGAKITDKNSFIGYLSLPSLFLCAVGFLWLHIKLMLKK